MESSGRCHGRHVPQHSAQVDFAHAVAAGPHQHYAPPPNAGSYAAPPQQLHPPPDRARPPPLHGLAGPHVGASAAQPEGQEERRKRFREFKEEKPVSCGTAHALYMDRLTQGIGCC